MSQSKLKKQSELTTEQSFGIMVQAVDKAAKEGVFGIKDASVVNEAVETLQAFLKRELENKEAMKEPVTEEALPELTK